MSRAPGFRRRRGLCAATQQMGPVCAARCPSPTRMGSDARMNVRAGPPRRIARMGGKTGFQRHRLHPRIGVVEEYETRGVISWTGIGQPGNGRGHGCPTLLFEHRQRMGDQAVDVAGTCLLLCLELYREVWECLRDCHTRIRQTSPEQPALIIRLLLSFASVIRFP